jgi:HrpA-like RNA helicase
MNLSTLKSTYLQRAVDTIIEIDKTEPQGDILVFLTGKNEVETCIRLLKEKLKSNSILCVPLYSSIGPAEQKTIFQPSVGVRKVVVATNIAQTSLTVPGIKFVVDSGFEKQKMYDPKTHMDGLVVTLISKAAANQRAGRAGRTEEGRVYRLYSKNIFEEMRDTTIPEIQRSSLLSTVLYLKRIGVQDVLSFPFIEPPNQDALVIALKQLYMIGALDEFGALTDMGKLISEFPISPFLARSLIAASNDFHCSSEVLTIVSMLSVENVFISTKGSTDISPQAKFFDKTGDHLTLLHIYNQWREKGSTDWCSHYRLNYKAIRAADNMRTQLKELMRKLNLVISFSNDRKAILSSICTGFYINTAKKHSQRSFYFPYWNSINGQSSSDMIALFISPQSALYEASDELKWVIYNNVEFVNQAGMKTVSKIDFAMVKDLFKDFGNVDMYKLTGLDIYRREIKLDSQIAQEPVAQIRPNIANDDIAKRVSEAKERYEARKRLKK